MSAQNMAVSRNFLEGMWNKRDFSVADRLVHLDHVPNGPMADQFPPGPEGAKAFTGLFINAFPDVQCTIEHQEADGDLVITDCVFNGAQTGQLMDIPPTGRRVTVRVRVTDRIAGGKIVESWSEWDPNDMMRQLGVG